MRRQYKKPKTLRVQKDLNVYYRPSEAAYRAWRRRRAMWKLRQELHNGKTK